MDTTPYTSRTIDSKAAYDAQLYLTNEKISFHEVLKIKLDTAIKINKRTLLTDYMRALKNDYCITITFNEEQARKFAYKPKLLSSAIYDNTEFYSLILRLNNMKSISDFTYEALLEGLIVPSTTVSDFLNEMLIKEKNPLNRNREKVQSDIKSL